jgi:hypothetical protein
VRSYYFTSQFVRINNDGDDDDYDDDDDDDDVDGDYSQSCFFLNLFIFFC